MTVLPRVPVRGSKAVRRSRRVRSAALRLLAVAALGACLPFLAQAAEDPLPTPTCPALPGDDVFLPCGEVVFYQPRLGVPIEPFKGGVLPSDGPLLDLTADDRAMRSIDGVLEGELSL